MQYPAAIAEPIDSESAESYTGSELSLRPRRNRATHPLRLLSPAEVDATLTHGAVHRRHPRIRQPGAALAKRLFDIVGALTLALVLSPLLLVVGLALASDRGPILYSHSRTGRHGRAFGCLKFRTMVPNAEQVLRDLLQSNPALRLEWLRDHKLRNDPRVTTVGRFLRRTSLDELPQLWNVLKGDMSLVGPRPVVREEWARYGRRLDTYLATKPGVTGLWQVMGRSDSCYRRRVALDCYYARRRGLLLDVFILLRTVKVVLRGRGAY
jgi:Undecaprenyl-phosphate galactose phosphotransferase WbaP